jgi:NADH-quinone oxidoreductase subunit C
MSDPSGAGPPADGGSDAEQDGGQEPAGPPADGGSDTEQDKQEPAAPLAATDTAPPAAPDTPSGPPDLHGCPLDPRTKAVVVHCNRADYLPLMTALKADGYALPVGVTGVDYLTHPGRDLPEGITAERFEVVIELLSLQLRRRVRVRCQVPAADPAVPTLYELWPGTEAHERETYDMFGIRFDGHPDPSRILMPEDWEGHPLRKDYDTGHIPVQFKEGPR